MMAWVEAKDGGFRVRWVCPDGSTETVSGFATRQEAHQRALELGGNGVDRAEWRAVDPSASAPGGVGLAPGGGVVLEEWVREWVRSHRVAPATAAKYEVHLRRHILPAFGQIPLGQITRLMVKRWGVHLYGAMAASYADSILALLSMILGEAVAERLVPANPCYRLRLERVAALERVHASPLQVLQVIGRLDEGAGLLVLTGAYTGMRWGELAGLAWDNVLLDGDLPEIRIPKAEGALVELGGRLWLDAPKTDSAVRSVHLPPFLAGILHSARRQTGSPYVFTGRNGAWLRRSNFRRRQWDPAVNGDPGHRDRGRRDGLVPGMTFHGLRHSHKVWMMEDEVKEYVQDRRLGHCTPGMTGLYGHLTSVMVAPVLAGLERRYHASVTDYVRWQMTRPLFPPLAHGTLNRVDEPGLGQLVHSEAAGVCR